MPEVNRSDLEHESSRDASATDATPAQPVSPDISRRFDPLPPTPDKPSLFDRAKNAARDTWKWTKERSNTVTRHLKKPWVLGAIGGGLVGLAVVGGAATGIGLVAFAGAAIIGAGAGVLYKAHREKQMNKLKLQEAQLQQSREGAWGMPATAQGYGAGFVQHPYLFPSPAAVQQMAAPAPIAAHLAHETWGMHAPAQGYPAGLVQPPPIAAHPVHLPVAPPTPAGLAGDVARIANLRSPNIPEPTPSADQQDQPNPSHRSTASTTVARRSSL